MSSISSSFRLFTTKIPISLHPNSLTSQKPQNLSLFRQISFQRIPTKLPQPTPPPSSSSSASSSIPLQSVEELPPKLQEIIKLFQSVQDPKSKYQQLMFYGKNLDPLDAQFKTSQNKVEGCVSQVWVRAYLDPIGNVFFEADSDSVLTKGLAALLVQGLSGRPIKEILQVSPDFAVLLGLQQSLTPSRNNGFLNMLKLMQKKAIELYVESERGNSMRDSLNSGPRSGTNTGNSSSGSSTGVDSDISVENLNSGSTSQMGVNESDSNSGGLGSRGERIKEKLEGELRPIELQVEDVSYQHAGHAGIRGSDGETHFNLKVVSKEFEGKSMVKRHRLIYELLQDELQSGLHALSIVAKTPSEVN